MSDNGESFPVLTTSRVLSTAVLHSGAIAATEPLRAVAIFLVSRDVLRSLIDICALLDEKVRTTLEFAMAGMWEVGVSLM